MELTACGKLRVIVFYRRQTGRGEDYVKGGDFFLGGVRELCKNHSTVLIKNLKYVGVGERGR